MAPTLKEVAKEAGVAISTASGILTERPDSWASESTRKRVQEAANRLGYEANRYARGLRIGSFQTIGLLVPDLLNPVYTVYARAIQEALEKAGYSLTVEEAKASLKGESAAVKKLLASQVDGILCFFMDMKAHEKLFTKQKNNNLPMVFFGDSYPNSGIDNVQIDFGRGTKEAIEELIKLGHSNIGVLYGYHPVPKERERADSRMEFFQTVLSKHDLPFPESNLLKSGHTMQNAYDRFKEYLDSTDPTDRVSAVFAINDILALGVMRAAIDHGLSIPEDLSIIGVDNTPMSQFSPIALSSVGYPIREIARTATDFLISRLQGDKEAQREVMFSTHLVHRESIAPPAVEVV
ncbi:LacI family DNA-binding transcriptional regulator [Pelagicoccus mobilis]|uniref:LacI family DNA-binding transcriptional regulator n=1 Tax=Pelagicoccus mobilis TaxID=415221 RepID=A0A934VL59_9BACT|nr:LacI family DNA-binding transcriptional regulator [Pelagicoccus mobilis]MBK1877416.1 LacI family DNA-binding transcriptional regulator [Pelagicoccus mobilis]